MIEKTMFRFASTVGQRRMMSTAVSAHRHYILNAFGPDRVGIVSDLSKIVLENGGNIGESRMVRMGGDFTVVMRLSIPKAHKDDLKERLKAEMENTSLELHQTSSENFDQTFTPRFIASFELEGADNPGLIHQVTKFFADRGCNVDKLSSETRGAPFGGTTLFIMKGMVVSEEDIDMDVMKAEFQELESDLSVDLSLSEVDDPLMAH